MKSQIVYMLRFAATFKVVLDCGHRFDCTVAEAGERQLFIGKMVSCEECTRERRV